MSASPRTTAASRRCWDLTANLSGSLFELPGGPLGLAVGVEYRDLKGRFDPDPVVAAGFSSDIPALPTKGSYDVKEAYAEINAPLLARPALRRLARVERRGALLRLFDGSGSTTTFKAGVNWKPIEDLRLRGSWAEGFRAPTDRRVVRHAVALRPGAQRSLLVARDNTQPRRFSNDARSAPIASRRAYPPRQLSAGQPADFGHHRRQRRSAA